MIVALARDGMAASITVTRSRTAILTRRQLTGSVSRSHGTHSSGLSLLSSYNASRYNRQYSTSLPPTDKGKAASTIPEPPLPIQQQKSRKVELRPGPVKPHITGGTVSVKASTPKANNASTESTKKEATPSTTSESVTAEEGIISSAKHDLEEAAQHGILAPPPPNAGTIHKLYHQAKELFKFYYRGLKLINTNRKRANEMRERVKQGGPQLTRWEHRFIKTAEEDMRKLVPFALIILIAEEVIPLVVMYAPFILPSTCILPAQKERIDSKRRAKQQAFAASQREVFARIHALGGSNAGKDVKHLLDGPGLVAMSGILGHSNYSLNVLRARNIRKHLTSVVEDDALLLREGRGSRLTPTEVVDALSERGIVADGLSTQQQQSRLQWWLNEVHKLSTSSDKSTHDPIASRVVLIAQGAISRQ